MVRGRRRKEREVEGRRLFKSRAAKLRSSRPPKTSRVTSLISRAMICLRGRETPQRGANTATNLGGGEGRRGAGSNNSSHFLRAMKSLNGKISRTNVMHNLFHTFCKNRRVKAPSVSTYSSPKFITLVQFNLRKLLLGTLRSKSAGVNRRYGAFFVASSIVLKIAWTLRRGFCL